MIINININNQTTNPTPKTNNNQLNTHKNTKRTKRNDELYL